MIKLTRNHLIALATALAIATTSTLTFAGEAFNSGSNSNVKPGSNSELEQFEAELKIENLGEKDEFQDPTKGSFAGQSSNSLTNRFFKSAKGKSSSTSILKIADKFFDQRSDISTDLGKKFCKKLSKDKKRLKISKKAFKKLCKNLKKLGKLHQNNGKGGGGGGVKPPTS